MDKYKIELQKDGKWAVFTRQYFWQRWKPYPAPLGHPTEYNSVDEALRTVGAAWWKEFTIRVDSIGVF